MNKQLLDKLKEALISVLPITLIVLILSFTPLARLDTKEIITFSISAVLMILGIGLFNQGADMAMQPMGEKIGSSLVKSRRIKLILLVCFIMGLLITVAEPDLSVLASQIGNIVNNWVLILVVGIGVGLFLMIAVLKIIFKLNLSLLLMFFYLMVFMLAALIAFNNNSAFLALAFDSGGVTTGPITVPFIMALGVGIAGTIGGRNAKENSFGLIALCSLGPIIVVSLIGLSINSNVFAQTATDLNYSAVHNYSIADNVFIAYLKGFLHSAKDVSIALGLIVLCFMIVEMIFIKLPKQKLYQIFIGIAFTFVGLVIFLTAASVGFLPIGYKIGVLIEQNSPALLIVFGFIMGFVVVLAEPAVHILTKQVEEITTGAVSKKTMLIALCIGVGISIGLSMIRIVYKFSILYYVIPGYLISLGLSFFVPKMYTAIAFDSGGVASGPLTSTFILPFAIGAAVASNSSILEVGFGIVSMVAMTPLITIQLLGFRAVVANKLRVKRRLQKIIEADDEQIINFM